MRGAYLGPRSAKTRFGSGLSRPERASAELDDDETASIAQRDALADEKAVGWFQGRMEFGPRALGARSILGDAALAEHAAATSTSR